MSLSRFTKVYNNLPLSERDMVCCVIGEEGISWKLAYEMIKENDEMGKRVQMELEKLDLI